MCQLFLSMMMMLSLTKIGGIGNVTERILKDVLGNNTCKDMLQKSSFLFALFSRSSADFFLSVGLGLGRTDVPKASSQKSMSNERTFSATNNEALLYQKIEKQKEKAGSTGRD